VPSLPVGAYDLAVKAAGFSTSKYNSVDVRLTETTRLNPSLGAPVAAKTEATAGTAHAEDVLMIATPPVVLVETGNPATGRTVTGKVKVEVVITAGGSVKAALLTGGNPVFEKSAADAVKQGRFEPAQTETKAAIVLEFEEW
jgi:TonB family protein